MTDKQQTTHYKVIGRLIRESIERRHGKLWRSTLSVDVARRVVARGHVSRV